MSRNARSRRYKLRREQFLVEVAESFRCSVGELRAAYQRFHDKRRQTIAPEPARHVAVYSGELAQNLGGHRRHVAGGAT